MGQCEMCGKDKLLVDAIVEGTMLSVCKGCAKFGHVIEIKKNQEINGHPQRTLEINKTKSFDKYMETIVNNYPELIKTTREKKGLKQEELAQAIAEKTSLIHNIESGNLEPPFNIAKKLEQFLRIELITKTKETYEKKEININNSEFTIGDLLKMQKD